MKMDKVQEARQEKIRLRFCSCGGVSQEITFQNLKGTPTKRMCLSCGKEVK